ncbi:MAG: S-methyl-5-thioribose-1-phosphate isomerase [Bacteroidales bacterium]|nr:S-methyl-5-thioribose-1-phosphate isomerase [Bacteroidales bacterium]
MKVNNKHYRSVWAEKNAVIIINQQKLPFEFELLRLTTLDEVIEAIKTLKVRGAPAIGITAAWAMWLEFINNGTIDKTAYQKLIQCRPTAVNIKRGADAVYHTFLNQTQQAKQLWQAAQQFADSEIEACKLIGQHGYKLLQQLYKEKQKTLNILTHCNAGWLACGDYGTALAPIFEAHSNGLPVHVWVDETRPLNQGARLTAWELANEQIPFDIISDNSGALLMMLNKVDAVMVGADRIVKNGDFANKIGTYQKALAAREHHVPFWVAAPHTTFDLSIDNGLQIPIEQRHGNELQFISGMYQQQRIEIALFPNSFSSVNHAFDITPASLVNAYITEKGIFENIKSWL